MSFTGLCSGPLAVVHQCNWVAQEQYQYCVFPAIIISALGRKVINDAQSSVLNVALAPLFFSRHKEQLYWLCNLLQ